VAATSATASKVTPPVLRAGVNGFATLNR